MIDDVLHLIVRDVRAAIDEGRYRAFIDETKKANKPRPSLRNAVQQAAPRAFIAEIKPASPSAGTLQPEGHETESRQEIGRGRAATYAAYGATAISVLTERDRFKGSLRLMANVAADQEAAVLMKDFVIHEDQLDAAAHAGASAVLFIEHLFRRGQTSWDLPEAIDAAHERGLEVLLEVDNETGFDHALATQADLIGINNRDLTTLQMDVGRTGDILRFRLDRVDRPVLALSGLETREDVLDMERAGAQGVLIGTTLMQSADVRATLRELRGLPHVKLCGNGHPDDTADAALITALSAADAVGVVVDAGGAGRERSTDEARTLFKKLPNDVEKIVVTTQQDPAAIATMVERTGATGVQVHAESDGTTLRAIRTALPTASCLITLLRVPPRGIDAADALPGHVAKRLEELDAARDSFDRLLIDTEPTAGADAGGTGTRVDVALAAQVVRMMAPTPVVLAGGLTPDDVGTVLRRVRPFGIDVSSGIEGGTRGRKDRDRIGAMLRAARQVSGLYDRTAEGPLPMATHTGTGDE